MKAVIVAGSNINPEIHMLSGIRRLRETVRVLSCSSAYRSAAIDRPDQPDYINVSLCVELPEHATVYSLRKTLRMVEADEGRIRTADRYAPRTLDLDIVIFGERIIDSEATERPYVALGFQDLKRHCPDLPEVSMDVESAAVSKDEYISRLLAEEDI